MYQRSGDWFLGVPFNIASYALLVYIVCNIVNNGMTGEQKELYGELVAGTLTMSFGDAHIYESHIDVVQEQLKRRPYRFPTLKINKSIKSISDLEFTDIVINDYMSHVALRADMVA
jgi:thymidylate synthase